MTYIVNLTLYLRHKTTEHILTTMFSQRTFYAQEYSLYLHPRSSEHAIDIIHEACVPRYECGAQLKGQGSSKHDVCFIQVKTRSAGESAAGKALTLGCTPEL
jgi:hypothetical protein